MLPVDKPKSFELAAIVAHCNDVSLELPGQGLVSDPFGIIQNVVEQPEDLLVVVLVEVESQLPKTFFPPLLFPTFLTSRPGRGLFF